MIQPVGKPPEVSSGPLLAEAAGANRYAGTRLVVTMIITMAMEMESIGKGIGNLFKT